MDIYWLQNGNKYSTSKIEGPSGKQLYDICILISIFLSFMSSYMINKI